MLEQAKSLHNAPINIQKRFLNLISLMAFSINHASLVNSLIMKNLFSSNLYGDHLLIEEMLKKHQHSSLHQISC